jgi:hypothetical protein
MLGSQVCSDFPVSLHPGGVPPTLRQRRQAVGPPPNQEGGTPVKNVGSEGISKHVSGAVRHWLLQKPPHRCSVPVANRLICVRSDSPHATVVRGAAGAL